MKEKEARKLYNSMTNVKEDYIEEAWKEKAKRKHPIWIKWGMAVACLFLGVIAAYAIPNIFVSTSENGDHMDAGMEDVSLDGNPNGYSTAQGEQPANDIEIAEQDQAAQKQETESLPEVSDNRDSELSEITTVVSDYSYGGEACYKAPDNGHCIYSIPLQKAMEEYGDMVLYKTVVDVFSDNNMFESNSEAVKNEIKRLAEIDYTVNFEHYNDGTMDHYYFVLYATQEQLTNFVRNDNYGYMFWLYDERAK